ncbi:unnamed protein product, partial [Tenebrio molitor]
MLFLSIIILLSLRSVECHLNNACKTYYDYLTIFVNPNCFYIPDNNDDVLNIIKRQTGVGEAHHVSTEDGYVLRLFRIPQQNPKEVILLQHGISQDAKAWVSQNNDSIAFLLWKSNYDVWLSNSRGTFYSQNHVTYKSSSEEFWNFTFHEKGYYDNKAVIEYIKTITKVSKIVYVGHSCGSTSSFVYASLRPEEAADSLKLIVALAPVTFLKYYKTPLIETLFRSVQFLVKNNLHKQLRVYSIFHHNGLLFKSVRFINRYFVFKKVIIYLSSLFLGWTPHEFDPNYVNLMVDQLGSADSMKNLAHYCQLADAEKFQYYDYGEKDNLKHYGTEQPPTYPLQNIKTPILLVYSVNDILSQEQDVEFLYSILPPEAKVCGKMKINGLNHGDFYYGLHRNEMIYNKIIDLLE